MVTIRRIRLTSFVLALFLAFATERSIEVKISAAPSVRENESCTDITTLDGSIHGAREQTTTTYKGIPYAAPPLDDLRFRPPAPVVPWTDLRDATRFATECAVGEDCLYVNVWRPDCVGRNLPVLVFLHPGMHTGGSAISSVFNVVNGIPWSTSFDGASLASTGRMVVVTLDYRIGPLGFLAHPALSAEDPNGSSGNYGVLDQIAALEWVRDNIERFGGSRTHVTIFGQSIGATDVCTLLVSPLARTLFDQAILSSEPGCSRPSLAWAETNQGTQIVAKVGCDTVVDVSACLRSKTHAELMAAYNPGAGSPPYRPDIRLGGNVDGWVLPEAPMSAISSGRLHRVNVLLGTTSAEYANLIGLMFRQFGPALTPEQYEAHIRHWFGVYGADVADAVLAHYPSDTFGPPASTLVRVLTDAYLTAPQRRLARALWMAQADTTTRDGHDDAARPSFVRRYVFTHGFMNAPLNFGAAHGVDLPFIFGNLWLTNVLGQMYLPAGSELSLSATVQAYVSAFAATGNPNYAGAIVWPPLDGSADRYLEIGDATAEGQRFRSADCDFWDLILPEPYPYVVP